MKKLVTVIITLSLILTLSIPISNAEETSDGWHSVSSNSDGVTLSVKSDKEVYSLGEEIFIAFKLKNDSDYDLYQSLVNMYHSTTFFVSASISNAEHQYHFNYNIVSPAFTTPILKSKKSFDFGEVSFNKNLSDPSNYIKYAGTYTVNFEIAYNLDKNGKDDYSTYYQNAKKLNVQFDIAIKDDELPIISKPSEWHSVESYGIVYSVRAAKDKFDISDKITVYFKVENKSDHDIYQNGYENDDHFVSTIYASRLNSYFSASAPPPIGDIVRLTLKPGESYESDAIELFLKELSPTKDVSRGIYKLSAYFNFFGKFDDIGIFSGLGSAIEFSSASAGLHFDLPIVEEKFADLSVSAANPAAAVLNHGDSTKYACTIRNLGDAATKGHIKVEFYKNNVLVDTAYITDSIPVDGSKVVVSDKSARESFGLNSLRVIVISDLTVNETIYTKELNYANNTLKTRYSVKDD